MGVLGLIYCLVVGVVNLLASGRVRVNLLFSCRGCLLASGSVRVNLFNWLVVGVVNLLASVRVNLLVSCSGC